MESGLCLFSELQIHNSDKTDLNSFTTVYFHCHYVELMLDSELVGLL